MKIIFFSEISRDCNGFVQLLLVIIVYCNQRIYFKSQQLMHFKYPSRIRHFLEEPGHKSRPYPLREQNNNQSSLEESPIPTKFRQDSERSPEQYLYPESLQPFNHHRTHATYDLKQKIIDLLSKLKDWLQELCLTETCINEVSEQLEPIIDEIKEINEEESENSYCLSGLPERRNQNSVIWKESHNNCPYSIIVSDKPQEYRNRSVLIHESREKSEIWLINEGEKNLVRLFFKKYYRLLENSLLRINRYCGQKKLKFLLETNIRNIFSETLRISYDLKMIQHKLKQEKMLRVQSNRNSYLFILTERIEMIFKERGGVKKAFKLLRKVYFDENRRDNAVVSEMITKIGRLSKIYCKNNRYNLQHFTYKWRESAYKLKIEEDISLVDCIRTNIQHILSDLIDFGDCVQTFSLHWRSLIEVNLNKLCFQLFQDEDCFFLDLQEMLNQRYTKRQKQITLAEYLDDSQCGTNRSRISKNHSFMNQLTVEELRACILSGQIHKNDKSDHNLLLIPIKAASGIFFVRLESSASLSDSRAPMKLSSFRCLLRIVELITPILEDLVNICKRMELCWSEVENNGHYSLLLKQFLKLDFLKSQQGHMQVQSKESEIQIDSNRLQSSSQTVKNILQRCRIDNLMIYHCNQSSINDLPCIIYGDRELALSQRYIIKSIYEELNNSGKKVLVINRNGQVFNILELEQGNLQRGLVHYTSESTEKIDNQMISQCLVPLLLRGEGKMSCEQCKVSLRLPKLHQLKQSSLSMQSDSFTGEVRRKPELTTATKLVTCNSLIELEQECARLLRNRANFFFKMVYKLDLSDLQNFYSIDSQGQLQLHNLKESEKLVHNEMFIEQYSNLSNCSSFAKLTYNSPCFPNPQLHIYQNQNEFHFKLVAIPIKNVHHYGYFLAAFYQEDEDIANEYIEFLKSIVECLNLNQAIFKPIKLNDQELEQYFTENEFKANKSIENSLFQRMREVKKGKFVESLNDFSFQLLEKMREINGNKHQLNVNAFKVNIKTMKMRSISSTKTENPREVTFHEDVIQLLTENEMVFTHQKLISSQCKLKKDSFNRTIKPIKLQKLNNISIFLPKLSENINSQLLQQITNRYKLKGLIANEYCQLLEEIDGLLSSGSPSSNQMYALLNIGKDEERSEMYFILLQQDVVQPLETSFINELVLQRFRSVFTKIYKESRRYEPNLLQKQASILHLSSILKGKHTVPHAIKCFYDNWTSKTQRTRQFYGKLSKYIPDNTSKNIKYYSTIRDAFNLLKKINNQLIQKYQIFLKRTLPTLQNIESRSLKEDAFKKIYFSIQQPLSLNHIRSVQRLKTFLNSKLRLIFRQNFISIKQTSELRHYLHKTSKQLSIYRLKNILVNIQKKEHYQHFFNQARKSYGHFVNSFDLIVQEYSSVEFNSKESFIIFANERFEALLAHISFGLVHSIEIGVAQICDKRLILYKSDQEKKFQEYITIKPESLEPKMHNNFNFLPIKVKLWSQHFLIYRIGMKEDRKSEKELDIVRNAIVKGIVPSYERYLQGHLERGEKFCITLMNLFCKEMWNGAADEAQSIYIFGKGSNSEQQCLKLKAISAIKHTKRSQLITELNLIRNAINDETKQYYRLEYEHNSISNALTCGIPQNLPRQQREIFEKYGDFITKDRLREMRDHTQKCEQEYERRSLQYQIKSKTFATSKIIMYYDRKEKGAVEQLCSSLISQEFKENSMRNNTIEKAMVEGKLELSANREKLKKVHKKQKLLSARSIYLVLGRLARVAAFQSKKSAFNLITWPKQSRLRS